VLVFLLGEMPARALPPAANEAPLARAVREQRIPAALRDRLAERGARERVLISLHAGAPSGARGPRPSRAEIRARADRVLASVPSGELRALRRFENVRALAAEVTARGLEALLAHPDVQQVDFDEGGTGHLAEATALINAPALERFGFTGSGVQIALLDSGVALAHPDVGPAVIAEQCFCNALGAGCCPNGETTQSGSGAAQDDHGHGTHVAGILVSGGTQAPLGIAPDAELISVKVLDASNRFCCTSDVIAGLDWLLTQRPDVDLVNASLGTSTLFSGDCDSANAATLALADAVDALRANGVLVVASAGNQGSNDKMSAPACLANAISATAVWDANVGPQFVPGVGPNGDGCNDLTTTKDKITCFSNHDAATDLFAPGAPILSAGLASPTSTFYGTSQAAPMVTGCLAGLIEAAPAATAAQRIAAITTSPKQITDSRNGITHPRLDCRAALQTLRPAALPALPAWGTLATALALATAARLAVSRRRRLPERGNSTA
jgi:subtilisin family serine protease